MINCYLFPSIIELWCLSETWSHILEWDNNKRRRKKPPYNSTSMKWQLNIKWFLYVVFFGCCCCYCSCFWWFVLSMHFFQSINFLVHTAMGNIIAIWIWMMAVDIDLALRLMHESHKSKIFEFNGFMINYHIVSYIKFWIVNFRYESTSWLTEWETKKWNVHIYSFTGFFFLAKNHIFW